MKFYQTRIKHIYMNTVGCPAGININMKILHGKLF